MFPKQLHGRMLAYDLGIYFSMEFAGRNNQIWIPFLEMGIFFPSHFDIFYLPVWFAEGLDFILTFSIQLEKHVLLLI